ncbi:MAG TPA: class I SAM-dependent methyltransferase [Acetobacteraceae bacterium]
MSGQSEINETAGKYWDQKLDEVRNKRVTRTRWWEDSTTKRHINAIVGNPDATEVHEAFHQRIARFFAGRNSLQAISVGCGAGTKEMWLMQMVDVARFDLYDISKANIAFGTEEAARQGISARVHLHAEDAFTARVGRDYDLVYWNNALHHMASVADSLRWSCDRLKPGGLLAIDDYIGPDRFQWTDENLAWANSVRQNLPDRFLRNPYAPEHLLPRELTRPTPEEVIALDPSEAVDSGRTSDVLRTLFPDCEIIPTGGALYHLALNDIFCNFTSEDDLALLRQILLLDRALAERGTTQYAVAFAVKP